MRILIAAFLLALPAFGQNVVNLSCDQTLLAPGGSSTCTITLDSPAPAVSTATVTVGKQTYTFNLSGGFTVTPYLATSGLVLSPAVLAVAAGATTATFTVTRPTQ